MAEQSFAPITTDPLAISFADDYIRERSERSRPSRNFLALLRDPSLNSYVPYAWGFTIYRVRFEGDSDDRFAKALRLFSKWTQWLVRASKFTEEGTRNLFPADVPVPSDDPTDDLADRLYNQVIEVYPNADSIVTGPEGEEDFSAVGEAFTKWVDALGINLTLSKNNTRHDQCLIIDKQALETLERLPEDLPPLRSERISHPNV
ncbi:hypothetical protein J3458_020225 [Metarhizium acridum]|uniref:uncharacterized protein n=1 Tax=Metarhizium acridum TaxID=92637 RepID=UPI001C6C67D5|nr:hypothetical protein J3458_020225 [Metarhizium acridum]